MSGWDLASIGWRLRALVPDLPAVRFVPEIDPDNGLLSWHLHWPQLHVRREYPGRWSWVLAVPGAVLDSGHADTWDAAMAVGLAALEVASVSERS